MTKQNSTFCRGNPTWANACVGDNGSPGYWDYAKGFSQAANLLIDQVLSNQGRNYLVDEFVYPVCFNMRHSAELRLKGAITQLQKINEIRGDTLDFDLSVSHDIGLLWTFFSEKSLSIDSRYHDLASSIEPRILDIAEVDSTGQTFRYPISTESKKHLTDVALINFVNLQNQFNALESDFDDLHRLSDYLIEEYSQGSFTKSLPRNQLFSLANNLPERDEWSNNTFDEIKKEIKESLGISSRELSLAIKIIENHYEFAPLIDIDLPLLGISDENLNRILGHWLRIYNVRSDNEPIVVESETMNLDEVFEEIEARTKVKQEIWEELSESLNPEVLAGVSALFYFGHELSFSERYIAIYRHYHEIARLAFERSPDEVRENLFHVMAKTNLAYNILRALYFLRKVKFADSLVSDYQLNDKFSWLDDARSGELFVKPEYCGYLPIG